MRVFSQINNCQQKQNKKQKQKTDKTKRGNPLLGLAKSIYYSSRSEEGRRPSERSEVYKFVAWGSREDR